MSDSTSGQIRWDDTPGSDTAAPVLTRAAAAAAPAAAPAATSGPSGITWDDTLPQQQPVLKRGGYGLLDIPKEIIGSAIHGTGSLVKGAGQLVDNAMPTQAVNLGAKIGEQMGGPAADSAPTWLRRPGTTVGDFVGGGIQKLGDAITGSESDAATAAKQQEVVSGQLMSPSSWRLGEGASSPMTLALKGSNIVGNMVPMLAGSEVAGARLASSAGTLLGGAVTGGLQGAQDASQGEADRITQMSPDDLASVPAYKAMVDRGMKPADAQAELAAQVRSGVFKTALPLATAAGTLSTVPLLSRAQGALAGVVGQSVLRRAAVGAAAEAPLQGAMSVGQSAAETATANKITGEQRDPLADSLGTFASGAAPGVAFGALGALHQSAPREPLRYPDAAAGSLSDAANTLHQGGEAPPSTAPESAAAAPEAPAPVAPDGQQSFKPVQRAQAVTPTWVDPQTGEVGKPSAYQITETLAQQMLAQYDTEGSLRVNPKELAETWGVDSDTLMRSREAAQNMASKAIADRERAAMQQSSTEEPTAAGDAGAGQAESPVDASIPFMITQGMKSELRSLGNTDADIAKMTPQQAHDALRAGEPMLGQSRELLGHDEPAADQAIAQQEAAQQSAQEAQEAAADESSKPSDTKPEAAPATDTSAQNVDAAPENAPEQPKAAPAVTEDAANPSPPSRSEEATDVEKELPQAPKFVKPPYEMSSDELDAHADAVKQHGTDLENSILGDQADAWRRALRERDSSNDDVSNRGEASLNDIESKLSKKSVDALYGVGAEGEGFDDLADFRAGHSNSQVSSASEAATELSRILPRLGNTKGKDPSTWSREQQVAYATIRGVRERIATEGWDSKEIQKSAIRQAALRFHDAADAGLMLKRWLDIPPSSPSIENRADPSVRALPSAEPKRIETAPVGVERPIQSVASRDAEGIRVQTPQGETTGRAHVDQLVRDGYTKVESVRAGDRMVHSMVNQEGDRVPIKARQLKYAQESAGRAAEAETPAAKVDAAAAQAASSPHNELPEPTAAQKEAGNYQKGHVNLQGLDISIENPRDSTRSGTRPDGTTWSHQMSDHYGYIRRTEGADGDHVDAYIGSKPDSKKVYVVDQIHQDTGKFDEHKVMLGFTGREKAEDAYKFNFDKGWKVGKITGMSMDEFKAWLKNGDTKKPIGEAARAGDSKSPSAPGNKVIDADGKPLTVYHGAREPFSGPFDAAKSRDAGVWFTPLESATKMYGDHAIPAHVRLENPYEAKVGGSRHRAIEKATDGGHDGIIVRDGDGKISTLSVFDSAAIHRLDEGQEPGSKAVFDRSGKDLDDIAAPLARRENDERSVLDSVKEAKKDPAFKELFDQVKGFEKGTLTEAYKPKYQELANRLSKAFGVDQVRVNFHDTSLANRGTYNGFYLPDRNVISLNRETLKPHEALSTFFHEFGHHMVFRTLGSELENSPHADPLWRAYQEWSRERAPDESLASARSSRQAFFRNLQTDRNGGGSDRTLSEVNERSRNDTLAPHEFFADMIARSLYEHEGVQKILGETAPIFQRIAQAMKLMFDMLRGYDKRITDTPEAFRQWVSDMWNRDGRAAEPDTGKDEALPDLGDKDINRDDSGQPMEPGKPRRSFSKASASIESMSEVMPKLDDGALQKAKDWLQGKLLDAEPHLLGALQLRHVLELAADQKVLAKPSRSYADTFQRMDGERNAMTMEGAAKAEKLNRFAYERGPGGWAGKLTDEAKGLFKFMHEVTQIAVDPTNDYQKLMMTDSRGEQMPWTEDLRKERIKALRDQMRGRSGDDKSQMMDQIKDLQSLPQREKARELKYPALVARWNAMSSQSKEMFSMMREHYQETSEKLEEAALARIEALDIPAQNKRAAQLMIRKNFSDAKVEGVYFPLSRFGDYWIASRSPTVGAGESATGGDYAFTKYESANAAMRAERQLRAAGHDIEATGKQNKDYSGQKPVSGSFMGELTAVLRAGNAPEKVMDEIHQMFLKTLPELSLRKSGIHRNNVAGYTDNVPRVFASNVLHGAHQISKARYGYQLEDLMEHMKGTLEAERTRMSVGSASHADALLGELAKRHQWIMNPTNSKLATMINSVGFTYYLSASPASALVNMTQGPMITLPVLGAQHGWPAAMRELGLATKDAMRTGGNLRRTLTSDMERRAFDTLEANGTFARTATHSLGGIAEGDALKMSPAYTKVMTAMGYLFQKAEVINRESAGIAAYRLAIKRGDGFSDAVKYADQIVNGTHFDYSNANRARYMQGNTQKVLFQFKNYALGMSWVMYRNLEQSLRGETPEVRRVARRTLTGILGMTSLFAGVMGTPINNLLSAGANAYHAATGDPDEPWDFNTEFRAWLKDHLGETAASVIADGAVDQLGANVSNRVGTGDLWFRDADRQLEGAEAYDQALESLAGPIGAMTKNMFVGSQQISEGHTERGIETLMPTFIKNAMKSVRFAAEGDNTLRGDPIVPDVTGPQQLIQALGFQPTRIAQQQRENSALKNYEEFIKDRKQNLMNAYAMAQQAGNDDAKSSTLERIQAFNQANPEMRISMATLRDSMRQRARLSAEAENGIVLSKKLAGRLRQEVGASAD